VAAFQFLSLLAQPEMNRSPHFKSAFDPDLVLPISDVRQALSWTMAGLQASGFPQHLPVFLKFSYSLIRKNLAQATEPRLLSVIGVPIWSNQINTIS
jgi:hypothetical protein